MASDSLAAEAGAESVHWFVKLNEEGTVLYTGGLVVLFCMLLEVAS